jgi:hypothetical protein
MPRQNGYARAETTVQQTQRLHRKTAPSLVEEKAPFRNTYMFRKYKNLGHESRGDWKQEWWCWRSSSNNRPTDRQSCELLVRRRGSDRVNRHLELQSWVSCERVDGQLGHEPGSLKTNGVGSLYEATTGGATADWEGLVRALMNYKECKLAILL